MENMEASCFGQQCMVSVLVFPLGKGRPIENMEASCFGQQCVVCCTSFPFGEG